MYIDIKIHFYMCAIPNIVLTVAFTKIIPSTICDRLAEPLAKSDDAIDSILVSYIYMYNKC